MIVLINLLRSIIPRNLGFVYMKYVIIFIFLFSLTSCASLPFMGGGVPSLGVEATMGDKEEAVVGNIGDTQNMSVQSLSGGVTTNNTQEIPIEFMLLLILGWLMPTPTEIFRGTKNFVLTLFGRKTNG